VIYLNEYKLLQDIIPIRVAPVNKKNSVLKSNDTQNFTFILPKPETKEARYFRISISENDLNYGLNSRAIKLD